MSRTADIAYAAGLFEGEGSAFATNHYWLRGQKRTRKTPQLKIQITMTDREPLEKFRGVFGGRVNGPYRPRRDAPANHQDQWQLMLDNQKSVKQALQVMYRHLSPRRQAKIDSLLGGEQH